MLQSPSMTETDVWLGTPAVARRLQVNVRTVYRFIDDKKLTAYRFGRVIRVKEADLDAFVDSQRIGQAS